MYPTKEYFDIANLDNGQMMKKGGWLEGYSKQTRLRGERGYTSKNIKTSINKLMLRNETLFGPKGKRIYDPLSKYQPGGATGQEKDQYFDEKARLAHQKMMEGIATDAYDEFVYGESPMSKDEQRQAGELSLGFNNLGDPYTYANAINNYTGRNTIPFTTRERPLPVNDIYGKTSRQIGNINDQSSGAYDNPGRPDSKKLLNSDLKPVQPAAEIVDRYDDYNWKFGGGLNKYQTAGQTTAKNYYPTSPEDYTKRKQMYNDSLAIANPGIDLLRKARSKEVNGMIPYVTWAPISDEYGKVDISKPYARLTAANRKEPVGKYNDIHASDPTGIYTGSYGITTYKKPTQKVYPYQAPAPIVNNTPMEQVQVKENKWGNMPYENTSYLLPESKPVSKGHFDMNKLAQKYYIDDKGKKTWLTESEYEQKRVPKKALGGWLNKYS